MRWPIVLCCLVALLASDARATCYREGPGVMRIWVEKVRYQPEAGEPGFVNLNFNIETGRFW